MPDLRLADLIADGALELNDGYRTKEAELGQPGVPILRVAEVLDGHIAPTFRDHVREEFRSQFGRKVSRKGDIILTTKGTIGRVAMIHCDSPEFVYSPQVCFFRVGDGSRIVPRWLYYWLQGDDFRSQALSIQGQTDMAPYINLVDLRAVQIRLPSSKEQHGIADVLGSLDDKIEANRRLSGTLDGFARAAVAEAQGVAQDMVSIGEIVERVGDVVQPARIDARTMYVGLEHIPRGSLFLRDWATAGAIASAKARFDAGDILFGRLRPYFKKVSIAPGPGVCSTDVLVLRPRSQQLAAVATVVCASDPVIAYASAGSEGTKMPRVSWEYLAQCAVPMPDDASVQAFCELLDPVLRCGVRLAFEAAALATVRDTLIPSLISGELRPRGGDGLLEGTA